MRRPHRATKIIVGVIILCCLQHTHIHSPVIALKMVAMETTIASLVEFPPDPDPLPAAPGSPLELLTLDVGLGSPCTDVDAIAEV